LVVFRGLGVKLLCRRGELSKLEYTEYVVEASPAIRHNRLTVKVFHVAAKATEDRKHLCCVQETSRINIAVLPECSAALQSMTRTL
jgi:hypothetical protein